MPLSAIDPRSARNYYATTSDCVCRVVFSHLEEINPFSAHSFLVFMNLLRSSIRPYSTMSKFTLRWGILATGGIAEVGLATRSAGK